MGPVKCSELNASKFTVFHCKQANRCVAQIPATKTLESGLIAFVNVRPTSFEEKT